LFWRTAFRRDPQLGPPVPIAVPTSAIGSARGLPGPDCPLASNI
jgi:hypothetical protein